jgi:hypothetical protein
MRPRPASVLLLIAFFGVAGRAAAGLYYAGETFAELPSQWRGFLLDQRTLRNIGLRPSATIQASPARLRYDDAAARLETTAKERKLTADETADLGALWIRLGETPKAVALLRAAQREHGNHFRIAANLGTAWQLQGDLDQAAVALQQAVRLAPGKLQRAEELHLKIVRLRQRQPRDAQDLDDLFSIEFMGEDGKYQPGKLAAAESKRLPSDAIALTQQLALWLPADGRVLWQLAELANAIGDVRTAAAIMDGCVTEFGMSADALRQHRQILRTAADELAKAAGDGAKAVHDGHAGSVLKARSTRPLLTKIDRAPLPPIDPKGVNAVPWNVFAETSLDRKFHPTFAKYLQELDGKQIALNGFMQPLGEETESAAFMLIEYPVGCWYCEMPEISGIVLVELPDGKSKTYTRGLIKITGKLKLNATDPENFLYTISAARVTEAE